MPALASIPAIDKIQQPRLQAGLARNLRDIRASQRLRYRVFAEELGARLASAPLGLDCDALDLYCDHLLVRDSHDQVIGSTRLLSADKARMAGGFYSAAEFELGSLSNLPGKILEVGRTCIDPAHRNGSTIAVLWAELATYIQHHQFDYLIGCASIELSEGEERIQQMLHYLQQHHRGAEDFGIRARNPYPMKASAFPGKPNLPPLLRAYMNLGAQICGEACLDPEFSVVDLFIFLDIRQLSTRYARHFLQRRA